MATENNYPSYLPEDFKGLASIQEGNQRYYYKVLQDGQNMLVGVIVGKRHLVIRFPEGSTIDIPKDSVGSEQIINGGVKQEDLDPDIEAADQDIDNIFTNQ